MLDSFGDNVIRRDQDLGKGTSLEGSKELLRLGMPLVFLCREEGEEEARVDEDHGSRR